MNDKLKKLASDLRSRGNTYGDFRALLFRREEMNELADLLDPPPRFNEQQMELLKALYGIGVLSLSSYNVNDNFMCGYDANNGTPVMIRIVELYPNHKGGTIAEPIDLAELFGKETNEKQ